jgi:hypothetical protein
MALSVCSDLLLVAEATINRPTDTIRGNSNPDLGMGRGGRPFRARSARR